ncbi:hypothetical protein F4859DRAFT_262336 [Xylaria cf. heliscus]|nr:hypothetical protein F4859DRAFT_262336 [Xylaria cf. heliscus]
MMDSSYVPPFRRRQAAGNSGDAPPAEDTPSNRPYQSTHHNSNQRGHRGYGRGSRGGYQRDSFQKPRSQVDQSDLYSPRDIYNYFWGSVDDTNDSRSSTFHDSKARPGQLSHLLLFFGANPRWADDHIVFAKSKLALLPEYAAKKAENGEWETKKTHVSARAASDNLGDDAPKDQDAAVVAHDPGSETVAQADGATPVQAQDSTTGAQELNLPGNDGAKKFTPRDSTKHTKREDQRAPTKVEGVTDHETQDAPIPTPSSPTATSSRPKYTDIRKGAESRDSPAHNRSTAPEIQTSMRTIPAPKFHRSPESFPVFPTIAPIDYVPTPTPTLTDTHPIAIFEEQQQQQPRGGGTDHTARFAFRGWFRISRINILAPHSASLVRMLQQKWERRDRFGNVLPTRARDASAWTASLAVEWAVVAFQPWQEKGEGDGDGEGAVSPPPPPPPQIEKLPEPERPIGKTVNEMLSDMRLNDGGGRKGGPSRDGEA